MPSVESLETFALQQRRRRPQRRRSAQPACCASTTSTGRANTPFAALLDTTLDNAYESSTELTAAHAAYKPSVTYPESSLASGLRCWRS